MEIEEFFEHHGVRGQKWGIRRGDNVLNRDQPRKTSREFRTAQELRKKRPEQLTNKQLETLNKRMNLERQYKNLNPSFIHSGKAKVEFILGTLGLGITVYNMMHHPATRRLMELGRKSTYKQLKLKL